MSHFPFEKGGEGRGDTLGISRAKADGSVVTLLWEQCWTVAPYPNPYWRPAFGPSCTEFVYPGYWHFDNEHGGLPHVLPAVHLKFFGAVKLREPF